MDPNFRKARTSARQRGGAAAGVQNLDQVEILGLNSKFELGEYELPEAYKNFNFTGFAGFPFSDVKPEADTSTSSSSSSEGSSSDTD